jgi:Ser/Thr protein kinase RdoA (MazF antagonist)
MTKVIGAEVYQDLPSSEDMKNLARAVAQFSIALADFDASKLYETIPNFHNTVVRYQTLLWSMVDNLLKRKDGRVEEAKEEVEFIRRNAGALGVIVSALERHDIPLRVTHNDTKLNNVLFGKDGKPICFIDLDTVMPGTILNDIADAIRYSANTCNEDERDLSKVAIDMELVRAHLEGFKAEAPNLLTLTEIELLPTAILDMALELGMRFLTDYFDGDVYFKINRADDNLNRARVQFRLAQSILDHFDEIKDLVNEVFDYEAKKAQVEYDVTH